MTDWSDVLADAGLADLVPDAFATYRSALVAGLARFLDGLPDARGAAILVEQATLGPDAEPAARLVALARRSPVLHKLGQVMARDRRLAPGLRAGLQTLESMPSRLDRAEATALVEHELDPVHRRGVTVTGPPIAEASVALVIPFAHRDPDRPAAPATHGVFKLLKPGIEEVLTDDLVVFQDIGPWLDRHCRLYRLPPIAYEATFAEVRRLLSREVDLEGERAHLRRARALYAASPAVVVPRPLPDLSTPRMTAMTRIDGVKITEIGDWPLAVRRRIAAQTLEAVVATPVWSADDPAEFHADPHAGNLIATDDGRIGLIDWSLTGTLSRDHRVLLARLGLGALSLDAGRILDVIAALAIEPIDRARLRQVVDPALDELVRGTPFGLDWMVGLLDAAVTRAEVRFGPDLLLFRKALLTLTGVLHDIADGPVSETALMQGFLARFGAESLERAVLPLNRAGPRTHLSTAELIGYVAQAPLTALSAWSRWVGGHWGRPRDRE